MKTICLTNNKGGVAKTMTTANVSHCMAKKGFRVLLVDMDPQANLTSFFRASTEGGTSYDLLNGKPATPYQVRENIFIIPSEGGLTAYEAEHTADPGRETALKTALMKAGYNFDFCLIDTPPAVGSLLVNSMTASNYCVIPTTADGFSIQGVAQVMNIIQSVKASMNPNLELAGVILTMYERRNLTKAGEDFLRGEFKEKVFATVIRNTIAVREACTQNKTVFEAKYNPVQEDFKGVAEELLNRVQNTVKTA